MSDTALPDLPINPSTCDINTLMSFVDEINAKPPPLTDADLLAIITFHRRNRAYRAAGGKAKPSSNAPSLSALMSKTQAGRAIAMSGPPTTPGLPAGPIRRV